MLSELSMKKMYNLGARAQIEENGGLVVECLTRDRGVAGLSLTRGTVLYPCARHFILCVVLVQPRKTCPDIAENC